MTASVSQLLKISLPSAIEDPGWPPHVDYAENPKVAVASHIIDWSWKDLSSDEREIVTRWAARIESLGFGIELSWGAEVLRNASAQVSKPIRALTEDEYGANNIVEALAGKVEIRKGVPNSDPLVKELAKIDAVELMPVAINASHFAAAGIEKVEVANFFPEWVLNEIQNEAMRTDRNWSHTIQSAWSISGAKLCVSTDEAAKALREATSANEPGLPQIRKQTLIFPTRMLAEIEAVAKNQDRSRSWLLKAAWVLAREELTKRP